MAGKTKQEQDLDDAQEEVIDEEQVEEEGEDKDAPDRGDDPDPDVNEDTLKKVAAEGDEAAAEEEADADESEEGAKKTPKTVPYGRLAKVTAEKAALEAELEELRAKKPAKEEQAEEEEEAYDFKAKEREYLKLVSEGELDAAADLRVEIDDRRADENQARATAAAVETIGRTKSDEDFGKAVAETLKTYPFLDNKSPEADKDAIDDVVAFRDHYITKKGLSPAEALRKAAERVAKDREEAESEAEEAEEEGKEKAKAAGAARTKAAVKKGAESATKQPPTIAKGKGNRTSEDAQLDVQEMSEDDFDKLPAEEKKRLRGD